MSKVAHHRALLGYVRLTIWPLGLPPNSTGRWIAAVHKRGQRSRSERLWSRSCARLELPHIYEARHTGCDLGFCLRVEVRPFSLHRKRSSDRQTKTHLTCGASLRNRTVDLLLTMDHQRVPVSAAEALDRQNTSSRWRGRAQISPHWLLSAPKLPPEMILAESSIRLLSLRADVRTYRQAHAQEKRGIYGQPIPAQRNSH
jgi:hypothetical protein